MTVAQSLVPIERMRSGSIAGLICDGAGWHQTEGELEVPNNIVLLPLAPYSPELNPMENVWEYLRGNKLSARVWDSYEAIVEACADAWNFFVNDPDRIRSIGMRGPVNSPPEAGSIRHPRPVETATPGRGHRAVRRGKLPLTNNFIW